MGNKLLSKTSTSTRYVSFPRLLSESFYQCVKNTSSDEYPQQCSIIDIVCTMQKYKTLIKLIYDIKLD